MFKNVKERFFRRESRARRNSDVEAATTWMRMGQFVSGRRKTHSESETTGNQTESITRRSPCTSTQYLAKYAELLREKGCIPDMFLVFERPSEKYVDADGDVADEFYAESTDSGRRRLMRIKHNLRPHKTERLSIPRLSHDIPVVMCEIRQP